MLAYLCLPKWCCIVACKQTKDKHIFVNVPLKLLSPEEFFQPKMHQISFGGRALPGPAGGAYSAPPDPLAGFQGTYFWGEG